MQAANFSVGNAAEWIRKNIYFSFQVVEIPVRFFADDTIKSIKTEVLGF